MLSVQRTQEILASLNLTDQQAEEVRDIALMLTELAYEDWEVKRLQERRAKSNEDRTSAEDSRSGAAS